MDCAGRAQRRRRFRTENRIRIIQCPPQSGVALRFPPQSKTFSGLRTCRSKSAAHFGLRRRRCALPAQSKNSPVWRHFKIIRHF